MSVTLREIDKGNWLECIKLEIAPEQAGFVSSNVFSLAQSKFEPQMKTMGIYAGDEMVGFIMYGFDYDDGNYVVLRLMVDARRQGKGYGRAAMLEAIRQMRMEPDCRQVALSYAPANKVAERLYESLGFRRTGEVISGENVMRLYFE